MIAVRGIDISAWSCEQLAQARLGPPRQMINASVTALLSAEADEVRGEIRALTADEGSLRVARLPRAGMYLISRCRSVAAQITSRSGAPRRPVCTRS